MSQESRVELQQQSQQLMDGPLKHIRAAALAAALVPLASVFANPASAQTPCAASAGLICGTVFVDANANGIYDTGDSPLAGVTVQISNGDTVTTDVNGNYSDFPSSPLASSYTISVLIPTDYSVGPSGPDNVGTSSNSPYSSVTVAPTGTPNNYGFATSAAANPGTGTPGYWKNHPEAWPSFTTITVGGVPYTKDQALAALGKVTKDRTTAMFAALLPAMLNVMIGNDKSCIQSTIDAANSWMMMYGPVGSGVSGGSAAWLSGDPIHNTLDAYNNGLLCAPHRK